MNEINLIAAFLIGLAGSVHCIGMCGGVMSAFTFAAPKEANRHHFVLSYNVGRILSYSMIGAATGYIGTIVSSATNTEIPILDYISITFLVLLALYISDIWKGLSVLEQLGSHVWKRIQPLSRLFIPVKNLKYAFMYGMIWGYLPCGLVYSALTWSLASGGAVKGAMLMAAFGLGTLPSLIAISVGANSLLPLMQHKVTRNLVALFLMLSAVFLIFT